MDDAMEAADLRRLLKDATERAQRAEMDLELARRTARDLLARMYPAVKDTGELVLPSFEDVAARWFKAYEEERRLSAAAGALLSEERIARADEQAQAKLGLAKGVERTRQLTECLRFVRRILEEGGGGVIVDTIWVGPGETLADRIDSLIGKFSDFYSASTDTLGPTEDGKTFTFDPVTGKLTEGSK